MKLFKKNQVIIYTIALMLVVAGYLNFTTKQEDPSVQASMQMEAQDDMQLADIGDARLVNSNDVASENTQNNENKIDNNTAKENNIVANTVSDENKTTDVNSQTNVTDDNKVQETNTVVSDEYFVKSKMERDTMYSQMMETYEKVLNSSNALEMQKEAATQEITKINEIKNSIMICENLIKTKGFENNIIFVNGESVSVIIGTNELKPEEIAQVQNIISRELKAEIENIHIATK